MSKTTDPIFTEQQLEHFREILLQWKNNLMIEVDHTMHSMQKVVSNYPDPNDRASHEEEFIVELRTRDRERKLIKKIEASLKTIDNGNYGFCITCGLPIGIPRLEVRPIATECIECKLQHDKKP